MLNNTISSTVALIQGTFDIAQARNTLRIKIAHRGWPTVFNAHAATALTALGELILVVAHTQPIPIRITTVEQPDRCGIELSSRFRMPDRQPAQWAERVRNLERTAVNTSFQEAGEVIEITTYIWVK